MNRGAGDRQNRTLAARDARGAGGVGLRVNPDRLAEAGGGEDQEKRDSLEKVLFFLAIAGITLIYCIAEAWYERDWPRDTFRYFAISIVALLMYCSQ